MSKPMPKAGALVRGGSVTPKRDWKRPFLAALAETSHVARAAKLAGIATSTAYETRRRNREFYTAWQAALCEGYDNLEMELLGRLRAGEIKRAPGAKTGVRIYDNATSYRQLVAHREAVAKEKGSRANVSAAEVRAVLDRKIAALRALVIADEEAKQLGLVADGK